MNRDTVSMRDKADNIIALLWVTAACEMSQNTTK
jgi:hypothetical protein